MKKPIRLLIIFLSILLLQNCEKDDLKSTPVSINNAETADEIFKTENFGNPTTGRFFGVIQDGTGVNLENVQITIGNTVTYTDQNGVFMVNNADVFENFAYIKATKEGYIQGSRVVIPKTTGVNNVTIVLIRKHITASINSGEVSEVGIGGAKVIFNGGFINEDGSPYNGQVDVILTSLKPGSYRTFRTMPGSLFAQTESNEARSLETYGMVSVNLFSPSGEKLNINENTPATIEFDISNSQMDIAPDIINLWFFDEEQGYWKEEGQAIKVEGKYIAEVSHFTWWNCDLPIDFVELCFEISPINNNNSTQYIVSIFRGSNQQLIYNGTISSQSGLECGLIPKDEEIYVRINSGSVSCYDQFIDLQTFGGFSVNTTIDIEFTENLQTTMINGVVNSCDGNPITNGYLYVDDTNIYSITDGTLNVGLQHCVNESVILQIYNFDTQQWTVLENIYLNGDLWDLGLINTCENTGGYANNNIVLLTQNDVDNFGQSDYLGINGNLTIGDNSVTPSDITDLAPLSSLFVVNGDIKINDNLNLNSLNGLNNISSPMSKLSILNNGLINLEGLEGLSSISFLEIANNNSLTSLNGLENLLINNWMLIGERIDFDTIASGPNSNLADFCALQNLFTNGVYTDGASTTTPFDGVNINNNDYNPTIQDIIDGNCIQ